MNKLVIICLTIFATTSSVAWAIAWGAAYGPPASAIVDCARNHEARGSAFCTELAKSAGLKS